MKVAGARMLFTDAMTIIVPWSLMGAAVGLKIVVYYINRRLW